MDSKKAQKRKQASTKQTSKKKKLSKEKDKFTHVKFKFLLRDKSTAISALEKFIEVAELFSESEETESVQDIVEEYCRSSPECGEIIALLEERKRKPSEVSLVFRCLECILTRVSADLQQFRNAGRGAAQRLLGDHSTSVHHQLGAGKSHHIKSVLKLLTAIVMLGGTAPTTLMAEVDFSQDCFYNLASRRDTRDDEDVRTCFVFLVLSLLHNGDRKVCAQLIDQKGLLQGVLGGLQYDSPELLETVLTKVLEKVVQNPGVTKTQKVRVFDERTLRSLASLYQWRGPTGWHALQKRRAEKEEDAVMPPPDSEQYQKVLDITQRFLKELFCSTKNGITFLDPSYGTSSKNQNHLVTAFLRSTVKLFDHSECGDLVTGILRVCPDQLCRYLPLMLGTLQPRLSEKWLACIALLIKIYGALPSVPAAVWSGGAAPPRLADTASVFLLPPQGITQLLHRGLEHKSMTVRHKALEMFKLILARTEEALREGQAREVTPEVLEAIKTGVLKACPDMAAVFQLWEKAVAGEDQEPEGSSEGIPKLPPLEHAVLIEQMVYVHQLLNPEVLTSNPTYLPRLLEGIHHLSSAAAKETDLEQEQTNLLPKLHLLKILAASDARKLPWTKKSQEGRSLMYLLLEMLMDVQQNQELAGATRNLLTKVLLRTGLFEEGEQELGIWLSHLCQVNEAGTGVLSFMAQVLTTYVCNPYPYFDQLLELCADTASLAVAGSGKMAAATSTEELIERVLALPDEEWETLGCLNTQTVPHPALRQKRIPFSPLSIVALEALQRLESSADATAREFVCGVLVDVFHLQTEPAPLSLLVSRKQELLPPNLATRYLVSWVQQAQPQEKSPVKRTKKTKNDSAAEAAFSTLWQQLWRLRGDAELAEDADFMEGLSESLLSAEERHHLLHSQTLLLFMADAISSFSKTTKKSKILLKIYFTLLSSLVQKLTHAAEEWEEEETTHSDEKKWIGHGEFSDSLESKTDRLEAVLENLLQHPMLCQWFGSCDLSRHHLTGFSKLMQQKLCRLVTDCMCSILQTVRSVSLSGHVKTILKSHADVLCSFISEQSREDGKDEKCLRREVALRALQTVLPFLDDSSSRKVLDVVLELPLEVLVSADHPRSLSDAGMMVVQIASKSLSSSAEKTKTELLSGTVSEAVSKPLNITEMQGNTRDESKPRCSITSDKVGRLFELLKTSSDPALDAYCTELVQTSPRFCRLCSAKVWCHLQSTVSPSRGVLMQQLLIHNSVCRREFALKVKESPDWLRQKKVVDSGLIVAYLKFCWNQHAVPEDTQVMEAIRNAYLRNAGKVAVETRESVLEVLSHLVQLGQVDAVWSSKLWSSLCQAAQQGDTVTQHHVELMRALLVSMAKDTEADQGRQVGQAMVAATVLLQAMVPSAKDSDDPMVSALLDLLLTALEMTPDAESLKTVAQSWMEFLETVLKHLYLVPALHRVLAKMVPCIYDGSCDPSCPIKSLQEMVMVRKLFLDVLFGEYGAEIKDAVVSLLLSIVETSGACCDSAHIKVLLGAYGATLSLADQRLLRMLHVYEQNGASLSKYRPCLWGSVATEHYSTENTGLSLWKEPSFEQIMATMDADKMQRSVLHFALRRSLINYDIHPAEDYHSTEDCYDPAFMLPFLFGLLEPGSRVDCLKLLESHSVGFLLAALSSHQAEVRALAYAALSHLYEHLEDARGLHCRLELRQLLKLLAASCQRPLRKLPCIIAIFLSRAVRIFLRPENHMYQVVKEFLELKPQMDLADVPEFYKLFNSSSTQHKQEQLWMLSLLSEGLRETSDSSILNRRYVLKLLLTFYDSPLCDSSAKMQILRLVQAHCSIRASDDLTLWLTAAMSDLQESSGKRAMAGEILRLLDAKDQRKTAARKLAQSKMAAIETTEGDRAESPMECDG